jgi:uncharacterized protein (TIGR00730 family)
MRRICVFCGSSAGARDVYREAALATGRSIARRALGLVYGGASVGLMGSVADGALDAGGEVIGVISTRRVSERSAHTGAPALEAKEIAHEGLTRLEVVGSMHERKERMAELADAFVALPGGMGTLEETAEILTWAQLGLHHKPCGLLDVEGYWAPLVAFLDQAVRERFLRPQHRDLLVVERDPEALLDRLAERAAGQPPGLARGHT